MTSDLLLPQTLLTQGTELAQNTGVKVLVGKSIALAMKRIPRRGCFSLTPRWTGQRQLPPSFVGTDRSYTIWSETMFLYCLYSMA